MVGKAPNDHVAVRRFANYQPSPVLVIYIKRALIRTYEFRKTFSVVYKIRNMSHH